ncbi:MAG: hypothetical protein RMM06_02705 [Armatimonadota bacterium]|nr:hypothetical protein [Armatimonadota bacterium]
MVSRGIQWLLVGGLCLLAMLVVADIAGSDSGAAVVPAQTLTRPPTLDGVLSAGEWQEATRIAPFWHLTEQREANFPTTAFLAYTAEGIYAAFDCQDPEPDKIHAQEIRRNADLSKDDYVEILIEPTGLDIEPYIFRVSARGTQYDHLPGGSASNVRWRGDWKTAVTRHERGWSAEVFIPFRMLRIPQGQQELGIVLARHVPRLSITYYYPNMGVAYDVLKRARWQGVRAPEVVPPPVLLPYLQLDSASGSTEWRSGLDVKLISRGGLTTLLTLNPDFKNIAREVDSVSFSYVPRLVRETRPFFIEGDAFFPDTTLFYSGTLQTVDAAVKSFGAIGKWSYGALATTGDGQRAVVGRLGYQMTPRSRAEVQLVHDNRPGMHATALGAGAVFMPAYRDGYASIGALYFRTSGQGMPVGEKMALSFWRYRGEGQVSFGAQLQQVSRSFVPTLGYAPEVGFRGYEGSLVYEDRWQDRLLQELHVGLTLGQRWNLDGGVLDENISLWSSAVLKNDLALWAQAQGYHRPPYRDRLLTLGLSWNYRRLYNSGGVMVSFGREAGGNSLFWRLAQGIPLTSQLRLKVEYERSQILYNMPNTPDRHLHQLILTLNYDLDAERSIGGRYIGRGSRFGDFNEIDTFYLTYRQQVRRGTDIFLIFGDPNASRTQTRFAVKVMTPW